jgi:hypothetical protein
MCVCVCVCVYFVSCAQLISLSRSQANCICTKYKFPGTERMNCFSVDEYFFEYITLFHLQGNNA